MLKKYSFYFIIIGIILLFLFCNFIFTLDIPNFPKDFSKLELLVSIFNIIFGGGILFGIYKWKKDRSFQEQDIFIENFNKLYFNARKLIKEDNLEFLTKNNYSPYLIENFKKLEILEKEGKGNIYAIFENGENLLVYNMINNFYKIKKNIEITEGLINLYELINFININNRIIKNNIDLKKYIKLKIRLFRNIKFFYSLFIIHIIYSKITLSEISFSIDKKDKKYLIINNNKLVKYILDLNKEFELLNKYL